MPSVTRYKLLLTTAALAGLFFTACGPSFSVKENGSTEFSDAASGEKAKPLLPAENKRQSSDGIYEILGGHVLKLPTSPLVTAKVSARSKNGIETITLTGELHQYTSTLKDQPDANGRHRIIGQLYCADAERCEFSLLDVRYKVGETVVKKQITSEALLNFRSTNSDEKSNVKKPAKPPEQTKPTAPAIDDFAEDEANSDPDFTGEGQMGDMVGAKPDTKAISLLEPVADGEPSKPANPNTKKQKGKSVDGKSKKTQPPTSGKVKPKTDSPPDKISNTDVNGIPQFLELSDGGQAIGCYSPNVVSADPGKSCKRGGRLSHATALPVTGPGFIRVHEEKPDGFGTGLLISAIQSAAGLLDKKSPPFLLEIGPIAKQNGGRLGTTSSHHGSHQNGLDIDIRYIGQKDNLSVLSKGGKLKNEIDFEKTWAFFKLIEQQTIDDDEGNPVTVLNRIFVGPKVKAAFCAWAKENKLLTNPEDADIMRRLRPDKAHYNHFHLRLKCSPEYPLCQQQNEPDPETGC
jgi:murein endopeptidase